MTRGRRGRSIFGRYRDCSGSLGALLCAVLGPATRNRPKTDPRDTRRRAARRLFEFVPLWPGRPISVVPRAGGRDRGQKTRPNPVWSGYVVKTLHALTRGGRRTRTRSDVWARTGRPRLDRSVQMRNRRSRTPIVFGFTVKSQKTDWPTISTIPISV